MTMAQRQFRAPAGAVPIPFANFPAALSADGQILRPAEVPRVELMASGGLWLPRGGRQVLQSRYTNPITVQSSAASQRFETIGPFPGGLVRANMELRLHWRFQAPAIGTGTRRLRPSIGAVGHALSTPAEFAHFASGTSSLTYSGWMDVYLSVLADGSANHAAPAAHNQGSVGVLSNGHVSSGSLGLSPTADFSQPWEIGLWGLSANETATNITSVSWSGGVATFVNPSHTLDTGDKTTVAGVSNTAYNGVYTGITRIDANTWSGTLVADPGGAGTGGTSSRISNVISKSFSLELWG